MRTCAGLVSAGRCLAAVLIVACATATHATPRQAGATDDDWQIFAAILDHTVRPEVERFSAIAGSDRPSLLLVLLETVSLCGTERNRSEPHCVQPESLERFRTPYRLPNGQSILPGGTAYDASLRTNLVDASLARNRQRQRLNEPAAPGVLLVPHAALQETLKQRASETVGYSAFSLPGYSADGYAMTYGFHTCGGRCNSETLFVLRRDSGKWQVELVWGLSVS